MTERKVTDLEDFALRQLVRPYQSMLDFPKAYSMSGQEKLITCLPYTLDELADMIAADSEWSRLVKDRVRKCNFFFPSYTQHRLVSVLQPDRVSA